MPRLKLHPASVGGLRPRPGHSQDYWWDETKGTPAGFGVRVSATGELKAVVRTYTVTYRQHGRQRFLSLGRVDAIALAAARDLARDALLEVADGKDPQGRKVQMRTAGDVAGLVKEFVDAGAVTKAEKTTREYRTMLKAHIEDSDLGKMPLPTVERRHVQAFLATIAEDAPVTANRLLQLVKAAFAWALRDDVSDFGLKADPCAGLKRPAKEEGRDRVLSPVELRVLLVALEALEEKGGEDAVTAGAIRTLLLLGTRRGETLSMEWEHLDLEAGLWNVPGTSRNGGAALTVPLSLQAKAVLKKLKSITGRGRFVFAGTRGGALLANPSRLKDDVDEALAAAAKKAKVKMGDWTLHDLRRTCATGCAEMGAPPHVIALILAHQNLPGAGRVTAVYDRANRAHEVAPWLQRWADRLDGLLGAEGGKIIRATFRT